MKPCPTRRKQIALLASNALNAEEAGRLRTHLETCAPCSEYLQELSGVTIALRRAESPVEIHASDAFHQQLVHRLRTEERAALPLWKVVALRIRTAPRWRLGLPFAAAAALIGALFLLLQPSAPTAPELPSNAPAPKATAETDLSPTVANYQMAASRSFEEFDRLLTRQARRPLPSVPMYTAAGFALQETVD